MNVARAAVEIFIWITQKARISCIHIATIALASMLPRRAKFLVESVTQLRKMTSHIRDSIPHRCLQKEQWGRGGGGERRGESEGKWVSTSVGLAREGRDKLYHPGGWLYRSPLELWDGGVMRRWHFEGVRSDQCPVLLRSLLCSSEDGGEKERLGDVPDATDDMR